MGNFNQLSMMINSSINFFIYCFMSSVFREVLYDIFGKFGKVLMCQKVGDSSYFRFIKMVLDFKFSLSFRTVGHLNFLVGVSVEVILRLPCAWIPLRTTMPREEWWRHTMKWPTLTLWKMQREGMHIRWKKLHHLFLKRYLFSILSTNFSKHAIRKHYFEIFLVSNDLIHSRWPSNTKDRDSVAIRLVVSCRTWNLHQVHAAPH